MGVIAAGVEGEVEGAYGARVTVMKGVTSQGGLHSVTSGMNRPLDVVTTIARLGLHHPVVFEREMNTDHETARQRDMTGVNDGVLGLRIPEIDDIEAQVPELAVMKATLTCHSPGERQEMFQTSRSLSSMTWMGEYTGRSTKIHYIEVASRLMAI